MENATHKGGAVAAAEKPIETVAYGRERLGQGREAARRYLLEHQDVLGAIRAQVLEKARMGGTGLSEAPANNWTGVQGGGTATKRLVAAAA